MAILLVIFELYLCSVWFVGLLSHGDRLLYVNVYIAMDVGHCLSA